MATMVHSRGFKSKYVSITTSTAVSLTDLGFTSSEVSDADHFHVQAVANGGLRYWYDGTVPTSSEGFLLFEGESQIFRGSVNGQKVRFIADSGATGNVEVAITLGKFF